MTTSQARKAFIQAAYPQDFEAPQWPNQPRSAPTMKRLRSLDFRAKTKHHAALPAPASWPENPPWRVRVLARIGRCVTSARADSSF